MKAHSCLYNATDGSWRKCHTLHNIFLVDDIATNDVDSRSGDFEVLHYFARCRLVGLC